MWYVVQGTWILARNEMRQVARSLGRWETVVWGGSVYQMAASPQLCSAPAAAKRAGSSPEPQEETCHGGPREGCWDGRLMVIRQDEDRIQCAYLLLALGCGVAHARGREQPPVTLPLGRREGSASSTRVASSFTPRRQASSVSFRNGK